jgi:hypothetical protein
MITGRPLSTTRNVSIIYWGMTLGAFGLVLGPWLGGSKPPLVSGLVLHVSSTVSLVVMMLRAFKASGKLDRPGAWHLISSYVWIIAPITMAPFIMFGIFQSGPIESIAPQAMIYGWVLQYGIALVPYIARRFFLKEETPQLGGSWVSLTAATAGSLFVWGSIFIVPARGVLYAIGFALYTLALARPLKEIFEIARTGLQKIEA